MKRLMTTALVLMTLGCGCAASKSPPAHAGPGEVRAPKLAPRVHFGTASTRISSRERGALDRNAAELAKHPGAVIVLEGHCDERGSEAYNMELGDRRARSVMSELMARGVNPERLIVISKGEREPLDKKHTDAAWRKNRRVNFVLR